jgi:hypothetical protein
MEYKFNIDEIYRNGRPFYGLAEPLPKFTKHRAAEAFVKRYQRESGVKIKHMDSWGSFAPEVGTVSELVRMNGAGELYLRSINTVYLPRPELYKDRAFYYKGLFHELTHSTMQTLGYYNKFVMSTAKEEQRAESTANRLMKHFSLGTEETVAFSKFYIETWKSMDVPTFWNIIFNKAVDTDVDGSKSFEYFKKFSTDNLNPLELNSI